MDASEDLVGRYGEIGFTEFVFPELSAEEIVVFEHVVQNRIQRLATSSTAS